MRRYILLFALLCILMPVLSYAQAPQELWVQRYNGTGYNYDESNAIALDQSGNVYVTGESKGVGSGLDYVTIKYDIYGYMSWAARYNGPGNGDDRATAIAVDNNGNVYVTGESKGSSGGLDYATVKYDTNGNQLWVARYNGPENSDDMAHGLALDGNGNVYVTGESKGHDTGLDYATIKYSTNGNQVWVKRYNGPVSSSDMAYAIAVDVSGNVYVTGESKGNGTCTDYATIKYDLNGNELWVKRYDGTANSYDAAYAIAVDGSGNIYVTGKIKNSSSYYDYTTIKYDSSGNQKWVKTYNGTGNGDDVAYALAVDSSGNVYVTGGSKGNGTDEDYATIKYDTNGNVLWIARYDSFYKDDSAHAIAVDNNGNVYVTGESRATEPNRSSEPDYATIKYDASGHEVWLARYNGPVNKKDSANAIAVDNNGCVYVTGGSEGSGTNIDYLTIKYGELKANFTGTPTSGYKPLTVQFTNSSTGNITNWSWSFGDGGTSTAQNPSHTYNTAGDFTVTLTVTGSGGSSTETKTNYIHVGGDAPPVANFTGTPTSGNLPLTVNFTDGSTGSITSRSWNFGDGGTSTAQNPSHTYTSTGTFTVTLTVTGQGGSDTETKTNYITCSEAPPAANFSGTPTTGNRPLTVQFTDSSTGSITSRSWAFGDGGTSTAQNPSHTYTSTGTYTVALTVTGPGGSDTETKAGYIVVTEAAPVANFSGTPTTGNRPLTVQFTDSSTGSITSRSWSFGDGGTSTAQNPSHTYTTTGNFTVSLTVTGPGGTDTETKTNYITVTEAVPVANFSGTPTSGYRPLTVQFTDSSTGSITGWLWNFGDSGTSTNQNPSHTYTTTGTFTVTLTVTGPGGSDTETKTNYITVTEAPPVANFSGTPTTGNRPLTVQFTDSSTGSITSRSWSFGDGGTSSQQNPSHTYTSIGTYTVVLTVTGPGGSDTKTMTNYISVTEAPPAANFSGTPTTGNRPLTVQFTDSSTGNITSRSWTFGDGGTSTQQNPSHTYTSTGTYTVALTVTGPGGSDTETKTGYIVVTEAAPVANFSGNPTSGYRPLTVNFTDGSTGNITSWSWSFGDGGTSTAQNPSHTYNANGTYTVSLTVTGPGGSDTETKTNHITVTEAPPAASFSGTPTNGYEPLTVQFTDSSTGVITSRSWTFGDGGTSTQQNPSHTYNTTGIFTVTLTVTGPGGTDTETKTGYINVNVATKANFSGTPTNGYRPLTVQFSDSSTGGVTSWSWTFGDGGTSTAQNPSNTYNANGTYTVSLTVTGPGGTDTATKTGYITVTEAPPVADFSGTPTTGYRPLTVQFTDSSTGVITSRSWTFGDGGTSTQQNPSHTYTAIGTYTVSLTVTGPGGSDTETKTGYIVVTEAAPVANFSGNPTSGYRPLTVNFTDGSTGSITSRSWTFGDGGTSTQQNPSHTYTTTGNFTVSLTVTGPGGTDTETKTNYITVTEAPPVANFSGTPTTGNRPLTVQFTDNSTGVVTSRLWNFGDGVTSNAQNPSHTYSSTGTYTVTLTVTGPGGSDSETKTNYVTVTEEPPVANFSGTPTSGYRPLTVQFTDGSTGSITSRSWSFGDGATSTAQNPSHTYTTTGNFTVALTVTGTGGTDTETKTNYITVTEATPVANFSGTPTSGYRPLTVQFTDSSTGVITSWSWTFGDGGTSTDQNPSHTYSSTGTYTVKLTVSGPGGTDVRTRSGYIQVTEALPSANFTGTPTSGIKPLTVQFTDSSTGSVTSRSWSFGDGATSTAQNPSHTYTTTGNFTVALTVTGPGGIDTETKTGYIIVSEAPPVANFSGTPTSGYKPLTVQFTDESTGNITSRSWSFGDGGTSTQQNPSHTYTTAGTFAVTLTVTGLGGTDTETKTGYIVVSDVLPPLAKFSTNKTSGNKPLTVQFTDESTGNINSWSWTFGDGGTSTVQNPSHTYTSAGTFTVRLTVTGTGGTDTLEKTNFITVTEAPPIADFSANIRIGNKPLLVLFSDSSTGNITNWLWSFGDGTTSTDQNPSHTYASTGNFTVTLTVTGISGSDSEIKVAYINVNDCNVYVPEDYPTIQRAIDVSAEGCTIIVHSGTYLENLNFHGKALRVKGVGTSGSCNCSSDLETKVTILGKFNDSVVTFNSGEGRTSILEGFTIKNGSAPKGGGIFMGNASPTIKDCFIYENNAYEEGGSPAYGGGIAIIGSNASPLIFNNLIFKNSAQNTLGGSLGGGIYVSDGASPTIQSCTIGDNFSNLSGGGIHISSDSAPVIIDSIIWNNDPGDLYCEAGCNNMNVTYSNVGENLSGIGNISAEPFFTPGTLSGEAGYYYLSQIRAGQQRNSPCVDSGSTLAPYAGLDTKNTANDGITDRGKVDMGFHYTPTPIYIQDAVTSPGTVFNRGQSIRYSITYRIEGNPETLYKVTGKINVKGAFKFAVSKFEKHYPGVYTMNFDKIVPSTSALGKATVTYTAIMRQAGKTLKLGTDIRTSEITVK